MKCFIWEIDSVTKVPKQIYESDNEKEFKDRILDCLNTDKSYGFRIERC
jgi:hypothetical protein